MGKVSLNINGRAYGLGCEAGEEERLMRLGQRLDARVAKMADQFGQIGDLRLLVMAGITLLDEIEDPDSTVALQIEERLGDMSKKLEAATKAQAFILQSLTTSWMKALALGRRAVWTVLAGARAKRSLSPVAHGPPLAY